MRSRLKVINFILHKVNKENWKAKAKKTWKSTIVSLRISCSRLEFVGIKVFFMKKKSNHIRVKFIHI